MYTMRFLMCVHNIHFHEKIRRVPLNISNTLKISKYLYSSTIERLFKGLKNEFESATVNNKRQNDCLRKQRTHYRLENGSLGFIETLYKH